MGVSATIVVCVVGLLVADDAEKTLPEKETQTDPTIQSPDLDRFTNDEHLDKTPPRKTKGLDLIKLGWKYDCMECHQSLNPQWTTGGRIRVEHESIVLKHGNNRFCLNCHHPTNRNVFVDYDGSEIAEEDVVALCARCHGPVHRDWKAGVHGRRSGFWDRTRGEPTQLRCIQCHDPHDPAFKGMQPLAPPHYPKRAADSSHHNDPSHTDDHRP